MARLWNGSNWIRRERRLAIYQRDGWRCLYCGSYEHLTLDHFRPVRHGGNNSTRNLFTACRSCNSSRQDIPVKTYCERIGNPDAYQEIINARGRKI